MPTRDNVIMLKRDCPKRVALPNGRTFLACYKHVTRDHLPANVRMRRCYRQRDAPLKRRRRLRQRGRGFSSILKFAKKLIKYPLVKI